MQIIEITRTLTLLFILLHLNVDTAMRLEGFTLLQPPLYSGLSFFQCHKLTKKDLKPKNVSAGYFRSCYFVNDCKKYAGYDKFTRENHYRQILSV